MFPAYTKYAFVNRIVIPGAIFSACTTYIIQPAISIEKFVVITLFSLVPAGYFLDVVRDWTGYVLERASKKVTPLKYVFYSLRKYFREYFFYLERKYELSSDEATKINFKFFFSLSDSQRYYLAIRQAWASFTINMFFAGMMLFLLLLIFSYLRNEWNIFTVGFLFSWALFFYYAGVYRLRAITLPYNLLLEEYYVSLKRKKEDV